MSRQIIQSTYIYFSPTGTTRKVLKGISQGLALRPRDIDLTLPASRLKPITTDRDELLVFGFPVYGGRLPVLVNDLFQRFPSGRRTVALVAVYGNRTYGDALLELYDLCSAKGYEIIGAGAFVGEHSYSHVMGENRPDAADEERARCFGLDLRQTLLADKVLSEKSLLAKAQRPYKPYPVRPDIIPQTSRRCAGCLLCVRNCPVGAFINDEPRQIDMTKCILCAACIKLCPEKAKAFVDDDFCDDMAVLVAANLDRKEPITFLP